MRIRISLFALLLICFALACKSKKKVNTKLASIYKENDNYFVKDYQFFNCNDSVSQLTINVNQNKLLFAKLPDTKIFLVHGVEPSMRWKQFCSQILANIELGERTVLITLGALLADVAHTRPIPVSGTTSSKRLQEISGFESSKYEGPTGILGILQSEFEVQGSPAVALWAALPHYVASPPCPKATLALIRGLEDLLDTAIPVVELVEEARAWQLGVEELSTEDEEISEYVRTLEETQDTAELPEATGEAIAREFERYLRRRGND